MPRDYKVFLEDIQVAIGKVSRYVAGLDLDAFRRDEKTVDAVVRNLQVIGEAVKGIPSAVRTRHADVEWKKIAGLRDVLIHEYFGINLEIVWDIVENKLPDLDRQVQRMLEE